jgi:cytochrome c oxidase cbb3-type subunit III
MKMKKISLIAFTLSLGCEVTFGPQEVKVPIGDGQPPDFETAEGVAFIPADTVYREMTLGKTFFLLDARPTNDYNIDHITSAYSIPFYEVEQHFDSYPVGDWIIAYCGCPHSESGVVAEYFFENGHPNVGILDEGYLYWKEQGYPTENGP